MRLTPFRWALPPPLKAVLAAGVCQLPLAIVCREIEREIAAPLRGERLREAMARQVRVVNATLRGKAR